MTTRDSALSETLRQSYTLARGQLVIALAWSSFLTFLTIARSRTQGWPGAALSLARVGLRVAGAGIWFSVGWLAVSEHRRSEREALAAGGLVGLAAAVFGFASGLLRRAFAPESFGKDGPPTAERM
ncbi:MAG: hypothetical protein ACYC1C_01075, partial [Chloroflexota bacterium]